MGRLALDLSGQISEKGLFEVLDYDYEALEHQKQPDADFEVDLEYLVNTATEKVTRGEKEDGKQSKGGGKAKGVGPSEVGPPGPRNLAAHTGVGPHTRVPSRPNSEKSSKAIKIKTKSKSLKPEVLHQQVTEDLWAISFSSDEETSGSRQNTAGSRIKLLKKPKCSEKAGDSGAYHPRTQNGSHAPLKAMEWTPSAATSRGDSRAAKQWQNNVHAHRISTDKQVKPSQQDTPKKPHKEHRQQFPRGLENSSPVLETPEIPEIPEIPEVSAFRKQKYPRNRPSSSNSSHSSSSPYSSYSSSSSNFSSSKHNTYKMSELEHVEIVIGHQNEGENVKEKKENIKEEKENVKEENGDVGLELEETIKELSIKENENENGESRDQAHSPHNGINPEAKKPEVKNDKKDKHKSTKNKAKNGTPKNGTPKNGTPRNGTPRNGTPRNGTPRNGTLKADLMKSPEKEKEKEKEKSEKEKLEKEKLEKEKLEKERSEKVEKERSEKVEKERSEKVEKEKEVKKVNGSSSRATKVTQLPAIPPVSTIFGLDHHQIFTSKTSDVKVKLLVNSKTSAMCRNALDFVHTANKAAQPLFHNTHRMTQFITVCVSVALYEASGFNTITKANPDLLSWLPEYDHLTLTHTKTNLTVSNKTAHRNQVDYTVLSFFGHILVWALHLQNEAHITPTLADRYGLSISTADVLRSLGGYHLWDRLRKEKTMNLKRWKHIQKFRQIFAFEENQFVLILRFMNLDTEIP